jgi:anti-sigma regulatory factor (Ser/Thr protein kinase)
VSDRATEQPPASEGTQVPEPVVLRLPPDLQSVGRARSKLVQLAAQWNCPDDLVEDARVVLSELMSNGVLHARTELQVMVSVLRGGGLRVEVHDASSLPVLPPMEFPETAASLLDEPPPVETVDDDWAAPTATGRGLAMVRALASTWGWFPDAAGGKVVWAELGAAPSGKLRVDSSYGERSPHPVRPVHLIALPLRLLKGSEDHFDDLFRELQMARLAAAPDDVWGPAGSPIADGTPFPTTEPGWSETAELSPADLAPMADDIKARIARLREPVRRAIWEAARRGDRLVDLDLLADTGLPAVFDMAGALLAQAARASRRGLLLTEPPGPEVVAWRKWLRQELVGQIAGKPPRACPFPVAPHHEEETGPAWERLDTARRNAVAELRSVLEGEGRPEAGTEVAPEPSEDLLTAAIRHLVTCLRARRCVLCLLADDNETVMFASSVGFSPAVAEYWRNYSLSADLPASEAIRTGMPLFFRTFAELDERYPIFLSTPSESDPALACLPLLRQGTYASVGCLTIGFGQARDFGPSEVGFLKEMAAEVSRFVAKQRDDRARRDAGQRKQDLDRAVVEMSRATTADGVLSELVQAVVAYVCDGAAIHVMGENGTAAFVMNRHRDPEREAAAARFLHKRHSHGDSTQMVAECARTGEPAVLQLVTEDVLGLAADDDEDLEMLRKVGSGSVGVVAARSAGQVVAVVTVANNPGRFITEDDIASVQRLADDAAEALGRLATESAGPGTG